MNKCGVLSPDYLKYLTMTYFKAKKPANPPAFKARKVRSLLSDLIDDSLNFLGFVHFGGSAIWLSKPKRLSVKSEIFFFSQKLLFFGLKAVIHK